MNDITIEIETLRARMEADAIRLAELRRSLPAVPVKDYELMTRDGPVQLSQFFQEMQDLIVIHNMGRACSYCTLWADGFSGVVDHLHDRCAVVLVSPDDADTLETLADERGWLFAVASAKGSSFTRDMGFESDGNPGPGFSTFHLNESGGIERIAQGEFGPFDPFCAIWHLFANLKDGVNGWEPKMAYEHGEPAAQGCGEGCGCHP